MSGTNQSVATPQIRFFQFETEKLGVFNKSVNLFRGDLNFNRRLFTMPSRPGRKDLDVDVAVQYQSNLQNVVTMQNLDAPTGILGLGWSMPLQKISLALTGAFSKANRRYTLNSDGIDSAMVLTEIRNGKEYYELENYKFWIIAYDPQGECWEVTHENGITHVFGGNVTKTPQGNNSSQGNSIAWGVRYGNWTGATKLTAGIEPIQFAREWYLSEIKNPWGDSVRYEYNGFRRGDNGLITGVEQFVGDAKGKPYTKAVYLTKITDVFNRTAVFDYSEKTFETISIDAPKEYEAAHTDHPNDPVPNGFQDVYETKYLNEIVVNNRKGNAIKKVQFEYHPLQNLSDFSGKLKGVTYKRYLKSFARYAPDGSCLPGLQFDYCFDKNLEDSNLGALQSITIPEGAVATYTYTKQALEICQRDQTILKPDLGGENWTPRVWFGTDFAVVIWYNLDSGKLWLGIYTWLGHWKLWKPNNGIIYQQQWGITLDSLNLIISEQSIAVHFKDESNTYLFIYGRNKRQEGQWISYGDGESAYLTFPTTEVSFNSGDNFVLANEQNNNTSSQTLTRITWNWKKQSWITEKNVYSVNSNKQIMFSAGMHEYYLTLAYTSADNSAIIQQHYLWLNPDNEYAWLQGSGLTLHNVDPADIHSFNFDLSESIAVLMVTNGDAPDSLSYTLHVLMWNEDYQMAPVQSFPFSTQKLDQKLPFDIMPQIISNSLIVSGENFLRYNGKDWLSNTGFQIASPASGNSYWFAYGHDFILRTINSANGAISAKMLVYDPNSPDDITKWSSVPFDPKPLPVAPRNNPGDAYYPTSGGQDYFTIGNAIYYRGSSTDWTVPGNSPSFLIKEDINSKSLIDQAPNFVAFLVPDELNPGNTKTIVLELKNGQIIGNGTYLDHQRYSLGNSNPGTSPYGPGSFVTYPGNTANGLFQNAEQLTLYRYAGHAIQGKINHFPVTQLNVTDGFGVAYATAYNFDPSSAACDPSGTVVKYYKSSVFPGASTPDPKAFGSIVNHYINGYNDLEQITYYLNGKEVKGLPAYPVLDGLKKCVEYLDANGQTVKKKDFTWDIFTQRNSHPTVGDPLPSQLSGSYSRQHSLTQTLDGVTEIISWNYIPKTFKAPFSGMFVERSKTNFNGMGVEELLSTSKIYGYEKYPELVALNQLNITLQEMQTVTPIRQTPIPVGVKVNTWKAMQPGKWAKYQTFKWEGGGKADFTFPADYSTPTGWLCSDKVTVINENGLIQEMHNTLSAPSSVLHDKNDEYIIAQFKNASILNGEADYYGFEAMEKGTGWSLQTQTQISSDCSYTGTHSLTLEQGGKLLKQFQPKLKQIYIIGYWYMTKKGFLPNNSSKWSATVNSNRPLTGDLLENPTMEKPFEDTGGKWVYDYLIVDLSVVDAASVVSVTVEATNGSQQLVYLDNVRWVPQTSNFSAYVYQPDSGVISTQIGRGPILERVFYDRFNRRIGAVNRYGDSLGKLYLNYSSRIGNNGIFNPKDPNCEVQLKMLNGGRNEIFTDGGAWQQNWKASNIQGNWKTELGRLLHTNATTEDTLSCLYEDLQSDFVLSFGIEAIDRSSKLLLGDVVALKLGNRNSISWNPEGKKWQFVVEGKTIAPWMNSDQMPQQWTLIVKPKTILFFADGRLLLSTVTSEPISEPPVFYTGKNAMAIHYLATGYRPMTGLVYKDALGHSRQNHALTAGNAVINQEIRNMLGKKAVKTKSAPANFGNDTSPIPLMAYRPDFVNVTDFLANFYDSGLMQGHLSTYYNGQNGASNDKGYPYHRELLEQSPLARTIEKGLPGKDLAIIKPWTMNPDLRKTVKFNYSNNKNTPVPGISDLPAGEYFVITQQQQDRAPSFQIKDKSSNPIVKGMHGNQSSHTNLGDADPTYDEQNTIQENTVPSLVNRRHVIHDLNGRNVVQLLPSYFDTNLPKNELFQNVKKYDTLNNLIESATPDGGMSQMIYNKAGQLRFQQDEEGRAKGYYGYCKYNNLNGLIEKGIITGQWDVGTLKAKANEADFPTTIQGQFVQKTIDFIGYDNGLSGLDKISCVKSYSEDGSGIVIKENFTYNANAKVESVRLQVLKGSAVEHEYTVTYEYLLSGLVKKLTYPTVADAHIGSVYYSYDDLGRMIAIGKSPEEKETYAAYTYTIENALASKKLNGNSLTTNMQYHPAGWISSLLEPDPNKGFNESLPEYSPNGLVTTINDSLKAEPVDQNLDIKATLNSNNLLSSVEFAQLEKWSISDMDYDPNGNLTSLTSGNAPMIYSYYPGTNQVEDIMYNGSKIQTLSYNRKGGVQEVITSEPGNMSDLKFTYLKNGYLTSSVDLTKSGDRCSFYYGSQGRRGLMQITNGETVLSEKISVHGSHALPLMEITSEGAATYIYGREGLVAFEKAGLQYFVAKDHLGSNRMVFNAQNQLQAAYSFSAFGENQVLFEAKPGLLTYLYTGQEWIPEIGLYNFRARLYDARLRRFYQTDPKHQYVGVYIFNGQNPLSHTDPTGMWSFWDIFSEIIEAIVSVAEIIGGIAVDVLSLGTLADAGGGTLLGMGISGAGSLIEEGAHGKPLSWAKFGEAQAIGAFTGTISAGIGAVGDAVAEAAVESTVMSAASQGLKTGVSVGIKVAFGVASGATSSLAGKMMENVFEGKSAGDGLGSDVWIGALMGGIGAGIGEAADGITTKFNMGKGGKLMVSITAGIITGAMGGGLSSWVNGKGKFNWLAFGISTTSGVIEAISGPLKEDTNEPLPYDIKTVRGGRNAIRSAYRARHVRMMARLGQDGDYIAADVLLTEF